MDPTAAPRRVIRPPTLKRGRSQDVHHSEKVRPPAALADAERSGVTRTSVNKAPDINTRHILEMF